MDWQLIVSLLISAGALVTYFAMGKAPLPKPPGQSGIQGDDAWRPALARQVDAEVIDRFTKALDAQSRPGQ